MTDIFKNSTETVVIPWLSGFTLIILQEWRIVNMRRLSFFFPQYMTIFCRFSEYASAILQDSCISNECLTKFKFFRRLSAKIVKYKRVFLQDTSTYKGRLAKLLIIRRKSYNILAYPLFVLQDSCIYNGYPATNLNVSFAFLLSFSVYDS